MPASVTQKPAKTGNVTGQQLRLAGERLAAVLNAALGQSSAD